MVDLTLDVDEAVVISTPTPTLEASKVVATDIVFKREVKFLERIPCNWHIEYNESGGILAKSRLGDIFDGTFDNFNTILARS